MKFFKNFLNWTVIILGVTIVVLYITDTDYLLKSVRTIYLKGHKTAYLEDYKEFDNRTIEKSVGQEWPMHIDYNTVKETEALKTWNETLGTIAFLIIKNDSIWFENYYSGFDKDSKSNSFSMAKSMVSAMLGKAIMEGKIKSLDQPVSDFYPEFSDGLASNLTVGDLSSMASGMDWDESYYSPFSITTRAYFYDDLEDMMLGVKINSEPGTSYKYLSGNTELLGMVIAKATGKTLADYLSDNFWKPLGCENEAFWQIDNDENGMEKAYCCVASNARDFARFGKLYKDQGNWYGQQVLDSAFILKSVTPRFSASPHYGYGWWLLQNYKGKNFFMMRGHLGQYVIVEPEDNIIIVRLGHLSAKKVGGAKPFSKDIYGYIDEAYNMMGNDK
jgi:CubicO group peptidase (beta-lactamase class C family)